MGTPTASPATSASVADLSTLLEQVFASGGTVRTLILALSARSASFSGSIFRSGLERYGLRPVFDAILQDRQVLEQLEAVAGSGPGEPRRLRMRLTQPLTISRRIGVGRLHLHIAQELELSADEHGEVWLRRGDITVTWLKLKEDVLVRLRPARDRSGAPLDLLVISAGHVLSQTQQLERITLAPPMVPQFAPAARAEVAPPHVPTATAPALMTPAPVAPATELSVDVTVVHRSAGRVRLHVRGLYRNELEKERLERALRGRSGLTEVTASSLTGSLLVRFEPALKPEAVERLLGRVISGRDQGEVGLRAQARHPWHLFDPEQTALLLETSADRGLRPEPAVARRQDYGANRLPQTPGRTAGEILLAQFASLPVALLGASAAVSLVTGGLLDAVVILGVVALNVGIGYTTEHWAEQTIAGLNRGVEPQARVIRDGTEQELASAALVPGDLIVLRRGMAVPADARLVDAEQLNVDESALTGESVPVGKAIAALDKRDTPLGARANMVYMGTVVTGGSGRALVVATGSSTEVGTIQRLLGEVRQPETPLQRQLRTLSTQLVAGALTICGGVFAVGLARGQPLVPLLKTTIALAVAAVPEGLPTVATTTLAVGLRRLEQEDVLVRRLVAVETLGSVAYLCLDKTGTITRNEMRLLAAYAGGTRYEHLGATFASQGATIRPAEAPELLEALRLTALCSEVVLEPHQDGPRLIGTPTETALVRAALEIGIDVAALRERHPLMRTRLRSEGRGFMDTLHRDGDHRLLAVKGSPDQVLALCDRVREGGIVRTLDNEDRERIAVENERMAGQALRVLGVAALPDDGLPEQRRDLIWAGLVGIADPPRAELPGLVDQLRHAGIRTLMITGDQSATAIAVARVIGLGREGQLESLDAARLDELPADVLRSLAQRVDIFSRVSPAHKLRIVQALQHAGHVVAMTGDGINDGPALRAADIGIAMGGTGSDVAQEVADIVVRDDNLATLIGAVEQGRTIYDDIKKAVHFILASNTSEIMLTLTATVSGLGEPLTALQLLWINLVTDVFPELALGLEPAERDVLRRPPRDPQAPMFQRTDVQRIAAEAGLLTAGALGAYGWGLARYGPGPRAGSLAFTTLTAAQLLYAVSCRSEQRWFLNREPALPNPYMTLAVGGGLGLQGVATLLPGLRGLLGAVPLGPGDLLVASLLAGIPFLGSELLKATSREAAARLATEGLHHGR